MSRWLPHWLLEAIEEWLAGTVIGMLTASFVVLLTAVLFPELEDYGVDLGIKVKTWWAQISRDSLTPDPRERHHYVFLDLDPGAVASDRTIGSTIGACCALERRVASPALPGSAAFRVYRVAPASGACPAPSLPVVTTSVPTQLECHQTRPLNRYLMAEVMDQLRNLGAARVVVDVALAPDPATGEEDKALIPAMQRWKDIGKPVVAVADIAAPSTAATVTTQARLATAYPAELTVALPIADTIVRRYRKCFVEVGTGQVVPSLPYRIAMLDTGRSLGPDCEADEPAPRIVYTVPGLEAHADSAPRQGADEPRVMHALYSQILTHCLAEHLWDERSACSQPYTFRDAIVVVGASNAHYRDNHLTPLGEMTGAEVVINAARSFVLYPNLHDKSVAAKLRSKLAITVICGFVWLAYYAVVQHRKQRLKRRPAGIWTSTTGLAGNVVLFVSAVVATLVVALWLAYLPGASTPSLDVVVPVLAVGLEAYAEVSGAIVGMVKQGIRSGAKYLASMGGNA